jgi:predicted AAA+ superfamily ATPase
VDLYPRYLAETIATALVDTPVVCLLGPRQAGKTTLAQHLEPERAYLSFDDSGLLDAAQSDPQGFVQGLPNKVILDEVQRAPELMPAIKAEVDRKREPGRFLLTGSANLLLLPAVTESLAGRMEIVHLNPLAETEKQKGQYRMLEEFLAGSIRPVIAENQDSIAGLPDAICSGGYPEPLIRTPARARQWYRQYLKAIIQRDVKDIAAIRDSDELLRLIELLANRTANLLNVSNLAQELGMRRETAGKYLSILEHLFLVRRLPAWHRNSAKRLVKTPKIHVIDSGLAAMLNRLNRSNWDSHSAEFGPLLESFVVQQLICQAGWTDSELQLFHYRDKDKVEVDLVIERGRQVWGVEVKRAARIRDNDAAGLGRLETQAGRSFQGGILLYTGPNCISLPIQNCFAVPMDWLWK